MTARALPAKRVEANGLTHHVVDQGEGPAILLMHGFPDSADLWRNQVPVLVDAGYRVIAPDLRGFGDSDRPEAVEDYLLFNTVADLRAIATALGVERALVVGHDFGAGAAWLTATFDAAFVEKLVAISVGHPSTFTRATLPQLRASWYTFMFQFADTAEALLAKDDWAVFRAWMDDHPDPDGVIGSMSRPGSLTAALNYYRANTRPELWGVDLPLPPVEVPTLGIWGAGDPFLTEEQMSGSARMVSAPWRYERVDDAGHWVPLRKPQALNALLLEFFAV
jgi:pimeloyl-ACP methyl ester carboxylesterase